MDNFGQIPADDQDHPVDDEQLRPGLRLRRLLSRYTLSQSSAHESAKPDDFNIDPKTGRIMEDTDAKDVPVSDADQANIPSASLSAQEEGQENTILEGAQSPAQEPADAPHTTAEQSAQEISAAELPDEDQWYSEVLIGDGLEEDQPQEAPQTGITFYPAPDILDQSFETAENTGVTEVKQSSSPETDQPAAPPQPAGLTTPLRSEPRPASREEATLPPSGIFDDGQLPRRVDEVDKFATRVTPAAYQARPPAGTRATSSAAARPAGPAGNAAGRMRSSAGSTGPGPAQSSVPASRYAAKSSSGRKKQPQKKNANLGCLYRVGIVMAFFLVALVIIGATFLVFQYFSILSSLPEIDDLKNRASQFETTRILDREGNKLYEVIDPNAGRRTYIALDEMSPYIIAATIATEDKEFYNHPGYDPVALMRALWQNYTNQEIVSGASTITQQLARTLLFSADERAERTYQRKAREIVLAAEITRKYSKEEILELYLNENNYGYLAYGIEAAAETYFHTNAASLNLAQASFLAGIPQAPAVYDIFTNREATLARHEDVVVLMYELSEEDNCIDVSISEQPVCVNAAEATRALDEIKNYQFEFDQNEMEHPHWVNYVRMLLEEEYGAETIYTSGFTVYTTLDPDLQELAEETVKAQIAALADRNANGGALVAIQPNTGEILAMVGSPDFYNEDSSGQVNMAISPRQPGSAIKPLTYTAAFEKGWTASELIWDVPTDFTPSGREDDNGPTYTPVNYDGRFHGPVTVRSALANSYNVPAVKALQYVGIYDDPATSQEDGLINFAERLGISTLTRDDYGLSLTLGGGEVTLLELTNAFSVYANEGRYVEPVAILKIVDHEGNVVYEYQPEEGERVIREEHAFIISSILSDNEARTPMFGSNSVLNLPFAAAVKTGTTNDYRDNWTIGYTPDLTVGVWIGNPDYTPMVNTSGVSGAAPIWSQFMQAANNDITGGNYSSFRRPAGIEDEVICTYSGTKPSEWCPSQYTEYFASDQLPKKKSEDLWVKAEIDTWTGLKASAECGDFVKEEFVLNVADASARKWIRNTEDGQEWAESLGFDEPLTFMPKRACTVDDPRPRILFAGLEEGQTITTNPFDIYALISASENFKQYRLDYGIGEDPSEWTNLIRRVTEQHDPPDRIYTWDLSEIKPGIITLRIYLNSTDEGRYAEKLIRLNIRVPTQTPTQTETPTATPTSTSTPTSTATPTVTATPPPPSATVPSPTHTTEPSATDSGG